MEGQQHSAKATSLSQKNNPKSQQNNLDKWSLELPQSTTSPASDVCEAAEQQLEDVEMVSPDSSESGCSHKIQFMETETEAQTHSSDSEEPVVSSIIDLEDEETAPLTPSDSLKDHKPVSQVTTDHKPVSEVPKDHKPVSDVPTDPKGDSDEQMEETVSQINRHLDKQQDTERSSSKGQGKITDFFAPSTRYSIEYLVL